VRVADSPAIVSNNVGDLILAEGLALDLAELEHSLLCVDLVGNVATLDVVEHAEELACLFDAHNIHETERVSVVSADLVVDFDQTFLVLDDLDHFVQAHGVLQPLLKENAQGNALPELVGSGTGTGCVDSIKFAQHPVVWCVNPLQVFLQTSCLHTGHKRLPLPSCLPRYILIIGSLPNLQYLIR